MASGHYWIADPDTHWSRPLVWAALATNAVPGSALPHRRRFRRLPIWCSTRSTSGA